MLFKGEMGRGRGSVYPLQSYVPSALRISKYTHFQMLPETTVLTLSGRRRGGGGGGGSEAQMAKLTASNQKPLILLCPNLVTFSFYS